MPSAPKHTWQFRPRFRARAFGWKGSSLATKRLKEAVTEIKRAAKSDPIIAADGAVTLLERLWPAIEHIDSSSGALGGAVNWTQAELLPLIVQAPADRNTRDKWLDRLWQAIQDDGVDYLSPTQDQWGELCGDPEVASHWADDFVDRVRADWADRKAGSSFLHGSTMCLSCLLACSRHQDLLDLLATARFPFWHYRKFGVRALLKEGRFDDALAFAEASRGLNQPDPTIDAACEQILLDNNRIEEAYQRYALTANQAATGVATFRAVAKKYACIDKTEILNDLARTSGDSGRYFAAAKDAGLYALALQFAKEGRTDPRTLSRACRDTAKDEPGFALHIGRLALERYLQGYGYDVTVLDVVDAHNHFIAAAGRLGIREIAMRDAVEMANEVKSKPLLPFANAILRAR